MTNPNNGEAKVPEDRCWYCDQSGTDHKHGDGRACGDCCGMHGALCHEDKDAYKWISDCLKVKNERIAKAESELVSLRTRNEQLEAENARITGLIETLRTIPAIQHIAAQATAEFEKRHAARSVKEEPRGKS